MFDCGFISTLEVICLVLVGSYVFVLLLLKQLSTNIMQVSYRSWASWVLAIHILQLWSKLHVQYC